MAISNTNGLQQSAVFFAVVAKSIAVYVNFAPFDEINALLAHRLQKTFIGSVKSFLQFTGNVGLHLLGPSAKEENGRFDYR